jgi:8-amino-7-oxononanoate synthase
VPSDLFERCRRFYHDAEYAREIGLTASPRMLEALGLYPFLQPIERSNGPTVQVEGRTLIMLGSNNYLGMTVHPRVVEAARRAIAAHGTGCTGSRFLNGTLEMHRDLEERLARFVGKARSAVFSTGYQTCVGVIAALLDRGDVVVMDREVHASVLDGVHLAIGRRGAVARWFRHDDPDALEEELAAVPEGVGRLVVVDGVYSMSGEVASLPSLAAVCRRHGARLLVDDAHGLGVLGGGRGTAHHLGCADEVDLVVGTFSKSFASCGGFVAGDAEVIHWIQHYARSYMFSASLPPANVATVAEVLDVLREEPWHVERVNALSAHVRHELAAAGYDVRDSRAAIVPIVVGEPFRAVQAWRQVFREGIYVNPVLPPAVPPRLAGLRTSYMATHTDAQVETALDRLRALRDRLARLTRRARAPSSAGADPPTA